jgi:hypothetical protein
MGGSLRSFQPLLHATQFAGEAGSVERVVARLLPVLFVVVAVSLVFAVRHDGGFEHLGFSLFYTFLSLFLELLLSLFLPFGQIVQPIRLLQQDLLVNP